jgi:CHAD domain-containing protein
LLRLAGKENYRQGEDTNLKKWNVKMAFRIERGETASSAVRRMAQEQIELALNYLSDPEDDFNKAVHEARKAFKRVRAILLLLRKDLGGDVYRRENSCFRVAGRQLAAMRDAWVKIETLQALAERYEHEINFESIVKVESELRINCDHAREKLLQDNRAFDNISKAVNLARSRVDSWPIAHIDDQSVFDGLERLYKKGRRLGEKAKSNQTGDNFHGWRKRVEYLWYLLSAMSPNDSHAMNSLAERYHVLSDYLGDDHDLIVLQEFLLAKTPINLSSQFIQIMKKRRHELRTAAIEEGEKLYAAPPENFILSLKETM